MLDLASGIASSYCSKLLADAGADVVHAEPPEGDPLRRWRSGALFEFLDASKRSVDEEEGMRLIGGADIAVVGRGFDLEALRAENPSLVVVSITPFGTTGPWADLPATEFTLQGWAGSIGYRGTPDRPPLAAGGRVGEWITGTYAAVGALAALRDAGRSGRGGFVDVAMLDCMAVTMTTFPYLFASFAGWPPFEGTGRTIEVPSIEPSSDGYVVFTTNSAQQFADFVSLIGRPEWSEDPKMARATGRFARRAEFLDAVHRFTEKRSSNELLDAASLLRIPAGPVLNGRTVATFDHFVERGVFVPSPSGRFVQPRVPYSVTGCESRPFTLAPSVGEHRGQVHWDPRPTPPKVERAQDEPTKPLDGIRVVDCTAWWAGPSATNALAALGADVIKVESTKRPDLMRYGTTRGPNVDQWWEWGALFHAANTGKRGVTIDLTQPAGIEVFERLVATADVLVENYTPRVMDQFGLTWEHLHDLHPSLIMVRMPAFGLDGPWRDRTGFAQTMECVSGMAWLTGFADGPPVLVRGACDPLAGMHAVFATLLALAQRDRDGQGRHVESVMVEATLNAAAEQLLEWSADGELLTRNGNRGPTAAPQNVYRCAGTDEWVAVAVETDEQWHALQRVVGEPDWMRDDDLATAAGRHARHDRIDKELAAWMVGRRATEVTALLVEAGVPAAVVIPPREVIENPQLQHRRLFEPEDHPVTGTHLIAGLPFRMEPVEHWLDRPSPTLGQHTREVLEPLGYDDDALAFLAASDVIGERPLGV